MSTPSLSGTAAVLLISLAATTGGCGLVGPSCHDESGTVFHVAAQAPPNGVTSYTVTSPRNSNLLMRLTWPDTAATLALAATITACGGHTGCALLTSRPSFGPGGSSPVPQPWPPGLRELQVDGWEGKTYRVDISGDSARDASFTLDVSYQIRCES